MLVKLLLVAIGFLVVGFFAAIPWFLVWAAFFSKDAKKDVEGRLILLGVVAALFCLFELAVLIDWLTGTATWFTH